MIEKVFLVCHDGLKGGFDFPIGFVENSDFRKKVMNLQFHGRVGR